MYSEREYTQFIEIGDNKMLNTLISSSNIIGYIVEKKIAFMWLIVAFMYAVIAYKKIKKWFR